MALIWMLLVKTAKVLQRWNRWLWPCLSLAQNAVDRRMNEQLRGMQGFDPESVSTMPQKSTYPLFHDSTTCLNIPSSTCLWNNLFNHHCFSVSLSMCQPFAGALGNSWPKHPIWMLGLGSGPWQLGSPGVPPLCRKSLFTLLRVCLALTWCARRSQEIWNRKKNLWPQLIETLPSKHFLLENSIISYIYTGWWFYLLTILKNISQWEGWHPIYYGKNVPNHQPV